jgi:biopolymer transport protein ExbD
MAGTGKGDDEGIIDNINVTPLVDVMLCLLVIFMVTTSYVVADSLKVDLPEASTGDHTEPSVVMITYTVDKDTGARQLYLNGDKSDEAGLRAHIRKVKAEGKKDIQAVIAADKSASHGEVIHIIDVVKQEGIIKFALNIDSGG